MRSEGPSDATTPVPACDAGHAARLADSEAFGAALARLRDDDERTLADQIELTGIPAPPFGEGARGRRYAELLADACAAPAWTDEVGNFRCRTGPEAEGAPIVVAAHLDTVFPEGTPITVARDGDRITGPGIGDDGRGLAAVLALARVLVGGGLRLRRPVLWVGTVGEEGAGDLRGVRHLFRDGGPGDGAAAFVSLDGAGTTRIVTRGVGSKRYRLGFEGPGGHSWSDWGVVNPLHALTRLAAALTRLTLPPGSTLSLGRMAGGISVNAIPERAWMEVDVRSGRDPVLEELEGVVREAMEHELTEANRERRPGTPQLLATWERFGSRPAGTTPEDAPLVVAMRAATEHLFGTSELDASSTDANVPMSRGIPAVTVGAGGDAGLAHTTEEWYRNTQGPEGIARVLLGLVLLDELSS